MQKYKDDLRRILQGFENSLRVKGLIQILNDIDTDTSITEEEIHRKFNIYFNKTVLTLRNKNRNGVINWISSEVEYILTLLYNYAKLNKTVYKVDKSLLDWYRSSKEYDDLYWSLNNIDNEGIIKYLGNLENVLVLYEDILYDVQVFPPNKNMPVTHICFAGVGSEELNPTGINFNYNFEDTNSSSEKPQRNIKCVCNCTSCPRYKQSYAKAYNDGGKEVFCTWEDCNNCEGFNKKGLLRPIDCEDLYKALFICINSHEGSHSSGNTSKEYEHIPLPMRTDDVVIYFGKSRKKRENFSERFAVNLDDGTINQVGIVGSHASPREHERRGGNRRAYVRKDGTKVRATTFKSTTVNKGLTKTTYKLKESK